MSVDHHSCASRLVLLTVALCAFVVVAAPSTASAQSDYYDYPDIDLSGLDVLSDLAAAMEAVLFGAPTMLGSVMFLGGLSGELTRTGRQFWFVANTVLGILNGVLAAMAFDLALEDEESSAHSRLLGYGAALTCTAVANLAIAIILRVDMDDEIWPRAIALEDVRGHLAPGVGFGAAF